METELERVNARLEEIGKPRLDMAHGRAAYVRSQSARLQWAATHPELEAEHAALALRASHLAREAEEAQREAEETERVAGVVEKCVGPRVAAALAKPNPKTRAWEGLAAFMGCDRTFLLLTGAPGTGKSVAASRLLQVAIAARRSAVFIRAAEAACFSLFDAADKARVAQMRRASCLVVDDLGLELLGDGWRQALDDVVDARYSARLETALTTNLDPAGFKARYGDRISDRIRHDGMVVQCGSQSLRKPGPA